MYSYISIMFTPAYNLHIIYIYIYIHTGEIMWMCSSRRWNFHKMTHVALIFIAPDMLLPVLAQA